MIDQLSIIQKLLISCEHDPGYSSSTSRVKFGQFKNTVDFKTQPLETARTHSHTLKPPEWKEIAHSHGCLNQILKRFEFEIFSAGRRMEKVCTNRDIATCIDKGS